MATHLNTLLVHLANLPESDARLPTQVLLPLNRQQLAEPILNLYTSLKADQSLTHLTRELAHLSGADEDMKRFQLDSTYSVANGANGKTLVRVGAVMTRLREGEGANPAEHEAVTWLMYHLQDNAPIATPGRNVVYLLRYLWFLSWRKELWDTVEVMDPYLRVMPEIVQGRYDRRARRLFVPQAAL